jgi:transposase-like protein
MATSESALTDLQHFWLAHVRAAAASGLTVKDYAAREGICAKKLYGWRRTCKQRGLLEASASEERFTRVQVLAPSPVPALRIVFPNGLALELGESFSETSLRRALAGLGWPQ